MTNQKTKIETIHEKVSALGLDHCFIGGHPMTGSEKTGYEHSGTLLLENAYYILTPTTQSKAEDLEFYTELIKTMGAIPITLDPAEHDKITAAISHVPHIIAAQLVNLIQNSGSLEPKIRLLAAGGFKDIMIKMPLQKQPRFLIPMVTIFISESRIFIVYNSKK